MKDVIVIGGGLAGLVGSILFRRQGLETVLIEKKRFPFHKVCGEYLSNELRPFLEREGLFPSIFNPQTIDELQLSATNGNSLTLPLESGGFGISRFVYDNWLKDLAIKEGVQVLEGTSVTGVQFHESEFQVDLSNGQEMKAVWVVGAHGKRSKIDQELDRRFMSRRSPYVGVKYHLRTDLVPDNRIALHNFEGGYCGVSRVEDRKFNLCYLTTRNFVKRYGEFRRWKRNICQEIPG